MDDCFYFFDYNSDRSIGNEIPYSMFKENGVDLVKDKEIRKELELLLNGPLPSDWKMYRHKKSGKIVFYNAKNGKVSSENPIISKYLKSLKKGIINSDFGNISNKDHKIIANSIDKTQQILDQIQSAYQKKLNDLKRNYKNEISKINRNMNLYTKKFDKTEYISVLEISKPECYESNFDNKNDFSELFESKDPNISQIENSLMVIASKQEELSEFCNEEKNYVNQCEKRLARQIKIINEELTNTSKYKRKSTILNDVPLTSMSPQPTKFNSVIDSFNFAHHKARKSTNSLRKILDEAKNDI